MKNVYDSYVQGLYQRYGYLAAWLPNTRVALGDVGVLEGKLFKRKTSLGALGVKFKVRPGDKPLLFNDDTKSGFKIKPKAAVVTGPGLPVEEAGLSIDFTSEGAFLFHAMDCYVDEIEDKVTIGKTLTLAYQRKEWELDWVVVDTLVRAGSTTILISNSRDAKLELKAKAGIDSLNLAKIDAGITVHAQRGDITKFLGEKGLTPLFRLSRFRRSWVEWLLGKPPTIHFGGTMERSVATTPPDDEVLEAAIPDMS